MEELNKLLERGANIVSASKEKAQEHFKKLDDINALYIVNPIRGGASVIIDGYDSFLYATSAVNFSDHLKAFVDGRRTDPKLFG